MLFYLPYNRCGHLKDEYKLTSHGLANMFILAFPAPWILTHSLKLNRLKGLELCCSLRRDHSRKGSKKLTVFYNQRWHRHPYSPYMALGKP